MALPKLDLASLPDLGPLTGVFAGTGGRGTGHDDSIVILATFVYETMPPGGGIV